MGNSVFRTLILIVCSLGAWRSVRLGSGLTPDDAQSHYRRWREEPARVEELDRALLLNPRLAAGWIARGLAAEAAGDPSRAEASFLRAAAADRAYLPNWTLANFYLRAGQTSNFWTWA